MGPMMNSTNIASGQFETAARMDGESTWLEMLFERASAHAALRLDGEARIVSWSGGAARLFGFDAHEIAGSPFTALFECADAMAGLPQRILDESRTDAGCHHTVSMVRKGGTRFQAACEITRLPEPHGGFGAIISDCSPQIREHQALEKVVHSFRRLRHTTQIRDRFLHVVAHELRTPLQAILGWVRLLRTRKLDSKNAERALEIIERSSRTQARLIEDLLDVSRLASGSMHVDMAPVGLTELLSQVLSPAGPVRAAAEAKHINIKNDSGGELILCADAQRLARALSVLCQYIIHRTQVGSSLTLEFSSSNDVARIVISAPGLPLPQEKLQEVFDEPVCDMGSPDRPAVGPGLAIVRRIIELHQGSINIELDASGGVKFILKLPRAAQAAAADNGRQS
jgi:PAS domain S-box-containing protein